MSDFDLLHVPLIDASTGGLSSRSPSPEHEGSYAPVRRSKDKQKHSESENRRRQRLRAKFTALQQAAGVGVAGKKDRFSILGQAVDKLHEYEARLAQVEQDNAALVARMATLTSSASSRTAPALSTPLSSFRMLDNLAVCYISLDGRILDANGAFVRLFHFTDPQLATPSPPSSTATLAASSTPSRAPSASPSSASDIYASSIFAITHHQELLHTLNILRNLLCGVVSSFECTKRCVDMQGGLLECSMTIASVLHMGKVVMFLCVFVPATDAVAGPDAQLLTHDSNLAEQRTQSLAFHSQSQSQSQTNHLSYHAVPVPSVHPGAATAPLANRRILFPCTPIPMHAAAAAPAGATRSLYQPGPTHAQSSDQATFFSPTLVRMTKAMTMPPSSDHAAGTSASSMPMDFADSTQQHQTLLSSPTVVTSSPSDGAEPANLSPPPSEAFSEPPLTHAQAAVPSPIVEHGPSLARPLSLTLAQQAGLLELASTAESTAYDTPDLARPLSNSLTQYAEGAVRLFSEESSPPPPSTARISSLSGVPI